MAELNRHRSMKLQSSFSWPAFRIQLGPEQHSALYEPVWKKLPVPFDRLPHHKEQTCILELLASRSQISR